ncbi:PqqD family protein [Thermomonas sp.]|uniref:PqqD family protein n=1 Tax=Thermomonas sp. TaxID=1971895 RepID=UPI002608293B|nr:PqqD family protein [Thermomonas sp.]MBL0227580.1 PqqD family protein [Thermomonas sp.]
MTSSPVSVTLASILQRADDVLYQEVGGEAVLLDLASEQYFGLDPVGTRIWHLLDGNDDLAHIQAVLADTYDAAPQRIGEELLALAQALADAGLVQVR